MKDAAKDKVLDTCLFCRVDHCKTHSLFLCMHSRAIVKYNRYTPKCRFEFPSLKVICDDDGVWC